MDAQSTTHLDELRRRRAELRESLNALEEATAAPAKGRAVVWGERVHDALEQVADDFAMHIVVTEGPDGLHQQILAAASRLMHAVTVLTVQHGQLAAAIADLVSATEPPVGEHDVDSIRERCTALLGTLVRHRQRGADLIYEAFETDIGGGF